MIDFEKFVKYSKPGPRYTSYPTAPEFNESFTQKDLIQLYKNQDKNRPLSLYIHMPFCRTACYFCGCNTIFTSKEENKVKYIRYLIKELNILKKYLNTNRLITQMHFGGGTPTYFSPSQLKEVIDKIKEIFPNFSEDAEISCEIDPRYFTIEHMNVLKQGGFNRLSFGVQDLDEKVQKTIHRIQPFELTQNVIKIARDAKINSINTDLIYGLPFQTKKSFHTTLEKMLSLNVDRFAVFNYAHVPWLIKTMRKFDETTFPSSKEKLEMLKDTIDFFTKNGYKMIGMDHFAKPEDELFKAINKNELHRNFQGYTTKGGSDLIGIGLTSIGSGENYYAQNLKDIKLWENEIDKENLPILKGYKLNFDDMIRKHIIMELMSNFTLDIRKFEEKFDINFKSYFKKELIVLEEFKNESLLIINSHNLEITSTGCMLIRNICMTFDAYLNKMFKEKHKFSKTV